MGGSVNSFFVGIRSKRKVLAFTASLFLLIVTFSALALGGWEKPQQPSPGGSGLVCLLPHPFKNSSFLVASEHQVFEGAGGKRWEPLWPSTDPQSRITRLFSFPGLPDFIFVLTDNALFLGDLKNRNWNMLYKNTGENLTSFAVDPQDPNHWLLGSQKGVLETDSAGKTWLPSKLFPQHRPVAALLFVPQGVFLADDHTLYFCSPQGAVRPIFQLPEESLDAALSQDDPHEASGSDDPFDQNTLQLKDLFYVSGDPSRLFLGTQKGVFKSEDGGKRWELMPTSGLQSLAVSRLAYDAKEDRLFAATSRGIYGYEIRSSRWVELFEGLADHHVRDIAVLHGEKILAVTGEGFSQYPLPQSLQKPSQEIPVYAPASETLRLFKELIELEPTARELHQQVIRYANVSNAKTKQWHAASKLAALLPSFSFGKSFSKANSIDLDRGGTNDPDRYILGPDDIDKGWDIDVGWDVGDLLYSSDQTSIDSREKLMVEMRNDLLSEATRTYYERRRLQIDILFSPALSEQEHLEKLLRLDELTSLLDGLTDGFFSEKLKRIYISRPEFNVLWEFPY